jgi:hypothetical protein
MNRAQLGQTKIKKEKRKRRGKDEEKINRLINNI